MSRIPDGSTINISYFLPSFARLRLYTYPRPEDSQNLRQDCFWGAMNFFNEKPDDRLFDANFKDKQLLSGYYPVSEKEKRFGDLLLLLGAGRNWLHICVYLADDAGFTT